VLLADIRGAARQEHPGKDGNVQSDILLRQEAVFCSEFDVAEAAHKWTAGRQVIGRRHRGRELQVRRSAVIEIDACFPVRVATRGDSLSERYISKCL
jgi:hypothetical protein